MPDVPACKPACLNRLTFSTRRTDSTHRTDHTHQTVFFEGVSLSTRLAQPARR